MEIMLGEKWDVGSLSLSNDTSKNSHNFSGTSVLVIIADFGVHLTLPSPAAAWRGRLRSVLYSLRERPF